MEAWAGGRVRVGVRGQRREATGRFCPHSSGRRCGNCRHGDLQGLHILVASSSENLPRLIKRGGLRGEGNREVRGRFILGSVQDNKAEPSRR